MPSHSQWTGLVTLMCRRGRSCSSKPASSRARAIGAALPSAGSGTSSVEVSMTRLSMPSPATAASTCSMVWIWTPSCCRMVRRPASGSKWAFSGRTSTDGDPGRSVRTKRTPESAGAGRKNSFPFSPVWSPTPVSEAGCLRVRCNRPLMPRDASAPPHASAHLLPRALRLELLDALLERLGALEQLRQALEEGLEALELDVGHGRIAGPGRVGRDRFRHAALPAHGGVRAETDVAAHARLPAQGHEVLELGAAGDPHRGDGDAVPPDHDVVADLDQVVDLGALAHPRAAGGRAVDRGVGPDLDVVADHDSADLRHLV